MRVEKERNIKGKCTWKKERNIKGNCTWKKKGIYKGNARARRKKRAVNWKFMSKKKET